MKFRTPGRPFREPACRRTAALYQNLAEKSLLAGRKAADSTSAKPSRLLSVWRFPRCPVPPTVRHSSPPNPAVNAAHHLGGTPVSTRLETLYQEIPIRRTHPIPDLDAFDARVHARFAQLLKADCRRRLFRHPSKIEFIITGWTDAVRHYDTALSSANPPNRSPRQPRPHPPLPQTPRRTPQGKESSKPQSLPQPQPGPKATLGGRKRVRATR
jgi:hypothetical protein